jgi:redox-sensitive bicupin YhaK (pirin superfamily)
MHFIRKSEERGQADHGWLKAKHSFSFGEYYDDRFLGYRDLRVINEDQVEGGGGFPTHGHQNMEIITYILSGALEHKDSMGSGSVIRPGDVQYMSAASGVMHSEFNHSKTEKVHLLQIWILPEKRGGAPLYHQKHFDSESRKNKLKLIASRSGREDSISIRQDVDLYASLMAQGSKVSFQLRAERYAWLQLARGSIKINGISLNSGDGLALSSEPHLLIEASQDSEFLLFDLL